MVNIDCLFSFTTAKINRTLIRFVERDKYIYIKETKRNVMVRRDVE